MKNIKTCCFSLLLSMAGLCSCTRQETAYTLEELQFKTDSIVGAQTEKLEQAAREDLNRRLPIELKVKLDSIFKVSYDIPQPPRLPAGAYSSTDSPPNASRQPSTDSIAGL